MAYNKAREERKWRIWKEAEEKQLSSLGVSEGDIEKLRVHDWAIFNSDRRYYEKLQDAGTYLEEVAEDTAQLFDNRIPIHQIHSLCDCNKRKRVQRYAMTRRKTASGKYRLEISDSSRFRQDPQRG